MRPKTRKGLFIPSKDTEQTEEGLKKEKKLPHINSNIFPPVLEVAGKDHTCEAGLQATRLQPLCQKPLT